MSSYAQLVARLQRMSGLAGAADVLGWDQQVVMPPGGTEARAAQMAALSSTIHEMMVSPETGRLLAAAEKEETDETHRALLREVRFVHDRETRVPAELVEKLSRATTRGFEAWVAARKASDYPAFKPILSEIIELKKRYAQLVDPGRPAYEVLFQDFEPWIPLDEARRNLAGLRDGLRPLLERARKAQPAPDVLRGHWPQPVQEALSREVVTMLGYDFTHGRLDASPHPFSSGGPYDARITTRYDPTTPIPSLLGSVHEAGHAMYSQGLPKEHHGTPLGDARDLVVHESQSRLWENHVGRSLPFWERVLPMIRAKLPDAMPGATAQDAWRAVNRVEPSLIRVEADELTYHMHVALRFEVEHAIFTGKLGLDEIPHRWNEIMKRDLGLVPADDAHGCLQDMHWSGGAFGYFPTYSLGSMLSAQLMAAYERGGGDATDYRALLAWLRERVHRHGKRYKTGELVERATGKALAPDDFLRYASEKYARVWA